MLVAETCKLLLRSRQWDTLLAEARRYESRWPNAARSGLHQALEVPYLLQPLDQSVPTRAELLDGALPSAGWLSSNYFTSLRSTPTTAATGRRQPSLSLNPPTGPLWIASGKTRKCLVTCDDGSS